MATIVLILHILSALTLCFSVLGSFFKSNISRTILFAILTGVSGVALAFLNGANIGSACLKIGGYLLIALVLEALLTTKSRKSRKQVALTS